MDSGCDPEITFDTKGVCNHCLSFRENDRIRKLHKQELPWVIYSIKKAGVGKKYDCLIGLSGGIDSSYALHLALEQGLRPLAFQIDNSWNTAAADENVMNLVETLKVPFFRYTIDIGAFRAAQEAFIKAGIKNLEVLTDHILFASTYEMAAKYGIKYVITGGNLATESIMPASFGEDPRDLYWIKSVYKKITGKKLKGIPTISLIREQYLRLIKGIKFIPLLDYYEYNKAEAKQLLKEKYGWVDYGGKHEESKFTQWFQNFYLIQKWGLDKRKPHFSSLINSGQMTREAALHELAVGTVQYFDNGWENLARSSPKKSYADYPNSAWIRQQVVKVYRFAKKLRP